jgi:hypothetical protein
VDRHPPPPPPPLPSGPELPWPPAPPAPPAGAIPYATPAARGTLPKVFHWGMFGWSAAVLGLWLALMLGVVPRFVETFRDFKVTLPATSRTMLALYRFLAAGGWVVVPVVPVALGLASARMRPGGRRILRGVMTLLFAALILLAVLGLLIPYLNLMSGMSAR